MSKKETPDSEKLIPYFLSESTYYRPMLETILKNQVAIMHHLKLMEGTKEEILSKMQDDIKESAKIVLNDTINHDLKTD